VNDTVQPGAFYYSDDPYEPVVVGGALLLSRLPWLDALGCAFSALELTRDAQQFEPMMEALEIWLDSRPQPPMDAVTRGAWMRLIHDLERGHPRDTAQAQALQAAVGLLRAVLAAEDAALAAESGNELVASMAFRAVREFTIQSFQRAAEAQRMRGDSEFPDRWWEACGGRVPDERFPSAPSREMMDGRRNGAPVTTGARLVAREDTARPSATDLAQMDDEWMSVVHEIKRRGV